MSVSLRPARGRKGWEIDIRFRWPDGTKHRERVNAPVTAKSAAQRWAEERERTLLAKGKGALVPPVPLAKVITLDAFWPRVVSDHYRANRKKPSTIEAAETAYRLHLKPALGEKSLDRIGNADVAALKGALAAKAPKTVNNVLAVLSRALRCAVEWGVLDRMPCRPGMLAIPPSSRDWYEREDFRRLVGAAGRVGTGHLVLVLLAGSAGLRRGEIVALKWTDLDFTRKQIRVERAIWRKHEESPKGGRGRIVPMTDELAAALSKHRHLRGERVLYSERGTALTNRVVRNWLSRVQRLAGVAHETRTNTGAIHMLRHTFCSHLAAAGVPAKAIQELAGHADLATTMRYMHLAPGDRVGAMSTLAAYYGGGATADGETEQKRRAG